MKISFAKNEFIIKTLITISIFCQKFEGSLFFQTKKGIPCYSIESKELGTSASYNNPKTKDLVSTSNTRRGITSTELSNRSMGIKYKNDLS